MKHGLATQGFFGVDCSSEASHLEYDVPVSKDEANFEYDFFQLPDINPAMLTHSVEVRISASYWSSGYGEWAAARPELLLLKVRSVLLTWRNHVKTSVAAHVIGWEFVGQSVCRCCCLQPVAHVILTCRLTGSTFSTLCS